MDEIIKDSDEDQFANGQSGRDLRVSSAAAEMEPQLMEAIDNIVDFIRFVPNLGPMSDRVSWRVEVAFKAGQLDNFRALTGELVESTLSEPVRFDYFQSTDGRGSFANGDFEPELRVT